MGLCAGARRTSAKLRAGVHGWSPGPVLNVPLADTSLVVHLRNQLPVPASLSVLGLRSRCIFPPEQRQQRAAECAVECGSPRGRRCCGLHSRSLRSGTFLYQARPGAELVQRLV